MSKRMQEGDPHGTEPSGYTGGNPSTSGPGSTEVTTSTPENKDGHLNPSAPEDSNTTPLAAPAQVLE